MALKMVVRVLSNSQVTQTEGNVEAFNLSYVSTLVRRSGSLHPPRSYSMFLQLLVIYGNTETRTPKGASEQMNRSFFVIKTSKHI